MRSAYSIYYLCIGKAGSKARNMTDQTLGMMKQKALVLVTFGSTYPGPHETFARIRAFFGEAYPEHDIFMAFTSGICARRWHQKTGELYHSADVLLEQIGSAGYSSVLIQSLHIIPGLEYSFIHDIYLPKFRERYPQIPVQVGVPLLNTEEDIRRVGDIIYGHFAERLTAGEALVLMGHGNDTDDFPEANAKYDQLNAYLQTLDEKIVIGTVDYEGMLYEEVEEYLREHCPAPATVNFFPLMSVAGDHALNDMAGEWEEGEPLEEQSWICRAQHAGYHSERDEHCHLYGLGDLPEILNIWLEHLRAAV